MLWVATGSLEEVAGVLVSLLLVVCGDGLIDVVIVVDAWRCWLRLVWLRVTLESLEGSCALSSGLQCGEFCCLVLLLVVVVVKLLDVWVLLLDDISGILACCCR